MTATNESARSFAAHGQQCYHTACHSRPWPVNPLSVAINIETPNVERPMPQNITLSSNDLVETARQAITELTPQQAIPLVGDPSVVLVDIRDVRELDRDGRVPGAFHCPRGMLEFWIDPASPYHKPVFAEDKQFVFFCGGGMRSVLATKVAQDMGLKPVAHIIGGFGGWKAAGGPIDKTERKPG